MEIYTVHVPVPAMARCRPSRIASVSYGTASHFWAFLLGPLWMIWNRLWLVLVIYLVAIAALFAGLTALGASSLVQFVVGFLIAVLIGCEAGSLRRWSLRRRWTQAGVVAARDLEEAERRFFESLTDGVPAAPAATTWPTSTPVAPSSPDVLGLFPQPEPRR